MNSDYDFEPDFSRLTSFMRTPMLKPSARNNHTAVLALNLLAQIAIDSSSSTFPAGRLLTTAHILHNIRYNEAKPFQKWIFEFDSGTATVPSGFLIVYRDLSCLIARIDDTQSEELGCQVLEILPIPLYIPERNMAKNEVEQVRFLGGKTSGSDVELCIQGSGQNYPLFSNKCFHDGGLDAKTIIAAREGINDAAAAWSAAFLSLPFLREPASGEPRTGTFDLTVPAPRPELSGLPYAWPVMLNWSDSTPAETQEMQHYLDKVVAFVMARNSTYISALQVKILAGRPTKPRSNPKLEVKANLIQLREDYESDISRYNQEIEDLLKDPRAPFDYSQREGSEIIQRRNKKVKRILSLPQRLALTTIRDPLSAHAQIEAIADFN